MRCLSPTKQTKFNNKIFGFDIETYNKNKDFLCATITYKEKAWFFTNKHDCMNFFKNRMFRGSIISTTNLAFDFMGTFFGEKEIKGFKFCWRDSQLLTAKSYTDHDTFKLSTSIKHGCITFIDTYNFAPISVEKAGKIIGLNKIDTPSFCEDEWIKWRNYSEFLEMKEYNRRDSEISEKLLRFLYESFYELGASQKITIGSTAMSLFRNKYLKRKIKQMPKICLDFCFASYFGGNVHAYSRGKIENMNYYDFNSLYPSVMINEFPDPESFVMVENGNIGLITNFEGVSDVSVSVGYMEYPILPVKVDGKLLFPIGEFRGKFTHLELREAVKRGYVITEIFNTLYFTESCRPFDDYVTDLYAMRLEFQKNNNPMSYVVKLLLVSLYGKFGQKYKKRTSIISIDTSVKELDKYNEIEEFGDHFLRVTKNEEKPAIHCMPIWATYITAYARLKLFDKIELLKPVYVDTDSLITGVKVETSKSLGSLKLEKTIKEGIIVKPKFYMLDGDPKIKGLMKKVTLNIRGCKVEELNAFAFGLILSGERVDFLKFAKFRESVRRGFVPNELIEAHKIFNLEDNKRLWSKGFSSEELQHSKPIFIDSEGDLFDYSVVYDVELEQDVLCNFKPLVENKRLKKPNMMDLVGEDTFDHKGADISKSEFLENEQFFAQQ